MDIPYIIISIVIFSKKLKVIKNPIYPDYININKYNELCLLCFKKLKILKNWKNKNKRKNRHIKKTLADYILLKILFNRDFFKDLKEYLKKSHCVVQTLINEYNRTEYTFKGLYKVFQIDN